MPSASQQLAARVAVPGFGVALCAIVGAAAFVRLLAAGAYPLSMDELFAVYWPRLGLDFLWGAGRREEVNPPLFFTLMRGWMALFGQSDLAVRLPSLFASLATVAAAGILGRWALGPPGGLLAAVILGLAPFSAWHALDARPASFVVLFQAGALVAAMAYLRRLDAVAAASGGRVAAALSPGERSALGGLFVACCALAVYTHALAAFFVAALGTASFAAVATHPRVARSEAAAWIGYGALIALALAPALPTFLAQSGAGGISWVPPLSTWSLQATVLPALLGVGAFEMAAPLRLGAAGALLAAAAFGALGLRGRPAVVVLVAAPALYLALLVGVSLARPVLVARMALITLVPLSVLLAAAALRPPGWPLRLLAGASLVAVFALAHARQWADPPTMNLSHSLRHEYRDVVGFLARGGCPGDVYAGHPWNLLGWPHYGPPPPGASLRAVRFAEERGAETDHALSRFAPMLGFTFVDQSEFLARLRAEGRGVVLIGRTAPSAPTMEHLLAGLGDEFEARRSSFGAGNNAIAVVCLAAARGGAPR